MATTATGRFCRPVEQTHTPACFTVNFQTASKWNKCFAHSMACDFYTSATNWLKNSLLLLKIAKSSGKMIKTIFFQYNLPVFFIPNTDTFARNHPSYPTDGHAALPG